jgi:hypothetical protein
VTRNRRDESDAPAGRDDDGPTLTDIRERKERVIHTRVPAVLEQELKRFADNLRVPVSNLIRTLLEDAVAVADRATGRVERELRSAAEHLEAERRKLGHRREAPGDPLAKVIGFQPLTLNLAAACARCAAPIGAGEDAFLGLTDGPGRVLVCARCVPRPGAPDERRKIEPRSEHRTDPPKSRKPRKGRSR